MTPPQIWQSVLGELELTLSKANFTTWFKNTFIGDYSENGEVILCVPSTFYKTWLERKFHQTLIKLIEKSSGKPVRALNYKIETAKTASFPKPTPAQSSCRPTTNQSQFHRIELKETAETSQNNTNFSSPATTLGSYGLNPRYTFDNFIVGKGNELAHAAAQAVAARPGIAYNPLFIYGGVGLGKTHLLQAIGHKILAQDSSKKVIYTSSERFTNEYVHSVRMSRGNDFKDVYRNVDLLIIDDIQFISGKEGTQEEFFHTFNTLHQNNKQVVISSDRPPKAIKLLESRLLSRFEWGMIADVASPDLETRIAILEAKCNEKGYMLDKKNITLVAEIIQNNVRELEGALNKIMAYYDLKQTPITEELIRATLSSMENYASNRVVSPKHIIQTVAGFYSVQIDDLLGKSREKRLAYPRQIIMYLLREEVKLSFPAIGQELGGRDHTTAMHACDKIGKEINTLPRSRENILQLKQQIYTA